MKDGNVAMARAAAHPDRWRRRNTLSRTVRPTETADAGPTDRIADQILEIVG